MNRTHTHTYAILEASRRTYDEIAGKLRQADYQHAFQDEAGYGVVLDMQGIALAAANDPPATADGQTTAVHDIALPAGAVAVALVYVEPNSDQLQIVSRMSDDHGLQNKVAGFLEKAAARLRTANATPEPAGEYGILEVMGHQSAAGRVSEEAKLGTTLVRVDMETRDGKTVTQYFHPQAIFRFTPTDRAAARRWMARRGRYEQPEPLQLAESTQPADPDPIARCGLVAPLDDAERPCVLALGHLGPCQPEDVE